MIVVGIMGIILTMGVPLVYRVWHKQPFAQAISGIEEVCSHARALAIMQNKEVDAVFLSDDHRFEIAGAGAARTAEGGPAPPPGDVAPALHRSGLSCRLSEKVAIASLRIAGVQYIQEGIHEATVRFFPNGTCDEMRLVLLSEDGDMRGIFLEVTTGLVSVESDRFKLQREIR